MTHDPADDAAAAARAAEEGTAALVKFSRQPGDPAPLDTAVTRLETAVALTPAGPDRASRLSNLAAAYFQRFRSAPERSDLARAVGHFREAVACAEEGDVRTAYLTNLCTALTTSVDRTGDPEHLDALIEALPELIDLTPARRTRRLITLGESLRRRWLARPCSDDLDRAIAVLQDAERTVPHPHPERALCLSSLGNAYLTRAHNDDVDAAVLTMTEAAELTAPPHPAHAASQANLGAALAVRARQRPDPEDLDRAVAALQRAVAAAEEDPLLPSFLVNLADALRTRAIDGDLETAVRSARRAQDLARNDDPNRAAMWSILGSTLTDLASLTADVAAAEEAVTSLQAAIDATARGHAHLPRRRGELARALGTLAELTGTIDEAAEDMLRAALAAVAPGSPDHGALLAGLAVATTRRAEADPNPLLIEAAIDLSRRAAQATAESPVDRLARLSNLGVALHLKARRTGDEDALDEALKTARSAVEERHPVDLRHGRSLNNLGAVLMTRYERYRHGADLDAAIDALRAAVQLTPADHTELLPRRSNLGTLLRMRAVRLRHRRDFDAAVVELQAAVEHASPDSPDRPGFLANLGAALQSRGEAVPDPEDLDEAIRVLEEAVGTGRPAYRHLYLSNLGNALLSRAEQQPASVGIAEAIRVQREALDGLHEHHPDRATVLGNLANALSSEYARAPDPATLAAATRAASAVAYDRSVQLQSRLLAAWRLADLAVRATAVTGPLDVAAGLPALLLATELAEQAVWSGLRPDDRTDAVQRFRGLPADAAAAAVGSARAGGAGAVALLEQGRSVGWRDFGHVREMDRLRAADAGLAARLTAVRTALDNH